MPQLDEHAQQDAHAVAAIIDLALARKDHDARRAAVSLVAIAQALVRRDQVGRVALAALMASAVVELLTVEADVSPRLH